MDTNSGYFADTLAFGTGGADGVVETGGAGTAVPRSPTTTTIKSTTSLPL